MENEGSNRLYVRKPHRLVKILLTINLFIKTDTGYNYVCNNNLQCIKIFYLPISYPVYINFPDFLFKFAEKTNNKKGCSLRLV